MPNKSDAAKPGEGSLLDGISQADEAASVAHDFIHGLNGVTKAQADAAIWTIHNALRPLIPLAAHPGYREVVKAIERLRDA